MDKLPNFEFEKVLWKKGYRLVGGCDEVGRGCFAGPVVSACVVFRDDKLSQHFSRTIMINDSKKVSAKKRELAYYWIRKNAFSYGIGKASASVINKLGIKKATELAFRKSIANLNKKLDFLLIDAFYIPYIKGLRRKNQLAIIKGDSKSFSIAAASIIAKVYRDSLMVKLGSKSKYKKYFWIENKGYGTKAHQHAIIKYGVTPYHRKVFVETFLSKLKN